LSGTNGGDKDERGVRKLWMVRYVQKTKTGNRKGWRYQPY
jgi:hypothetical protein